MDPNLPPTPPLPPLPQSSVPPEIPSIRPPRPSEASSAGGLRLASPGPSKKSRKLFAGIAGLIVLISAIGSGIYFGVLRPQELRKQAFDTDFQGPCCDQNGCYTSNNGCSTGGYPYPTFWVNRYHCPDTTGGACSGAQYLVETAVPSATFQEDCGIEQIDIGGVSGGTNMFSSRNYDNICSPEPTPEPEPTPTSPPPTGGPTPTIAIPNCWLDGPTCIAVGSPANFQGTFTSPQGNLAGQISKDALSNPFQYQTLPGNSASFTVTWTPTASEIGNHYVYCQAWNDSIAECRPPQFVDFPPRYACVGSTPGANDYQLAVTVQTSCGPAPTPTATPIPTPTAVPPTLTPTPIPTSPPTATPTLPPGVIAQCVSLIAKKQDANGIWQTINPTVDARPGDIIKFVVGGSLNSGNFTRAAFFINGGQPILDNTPIDGFSTVYTIASAGQLDVGAVLYHSTEGWVD